MSEQEFELFLKLLSRSLKLTRAQRDAIADELRDHLEARLAELVSQGIERQQAITQALAEFGDAAVLAGNFASVARFRRRRILMRVSLGSVAVLTAALLVGSALWPEKPGPAAPARVIGETTAKTPDEPGVPKVSMVQVVSRPVVEQLSFVGRLAPSQSITIRAQVSGPLTKVLFPLGGAVKKGDLLFEIDPGTYPAELYKAQAALAGAKARLVRMRADFEQAKAQLELSIGSAAKVKVNRAKGDLEETEAELQSLEAGVEIARLNFSRTKLTAAIDGTISRPSIDSGNLVTAGETVLATLVATDPILVDFNIDEPSFLRMRKAVRVGNLKPSEIAVSIRLGDESEFKRTGKLEGLDGAQNSPHGFVLRGLLANTDRELVPGLVANVRVNLRDKPSNALVVPQGAVYGKSDGGLFVFVVNGQNVLEERSVQVAGRFDEFKVVGAGLEAGEWIVDKLRIPVYAGMKVEPVRDGGK